MALYSSLHDSTLHFVDDATKPRSRNSNNKPYRFRPLSPIVNVQENKPFTLERKVPLSPLTLRQHDSLVAPHQLDLTPSSSSGMPPLTDLTSSTHSNDVEHNNKPPSRPGSVRSNSKTNSDWESLQITTKNGRTASLVEISDARLSATSRNPPDASVMNDVLLTVSRQTTHLSEIHESASEFEESADPVVLPSSSHPEVRLLKSESTASTVIIHDYSRPTSVQPDSIVGFDEDHEDDDEIDVGDDVEDVEDVDFDKDDDHPMSMKLFRIHMADRIRSRFDLILMDLDDRIEIQKRSLDAMMMVA